MLHWEMDEAVGEMSGCKLAARAVLRRAIEAEKETHALDVCTKCTYSKNRVGFEWDEDSKAGINFRKHGVRMPEAIPVFDDPCAITIVDDESDPSEQRFVTLGMGAEAVCL